MTTAKLASEGKVWLCLQCGKYRKDMYSQWGSWDEACALNCVEADEVTLEPDAEQVRGLNEQRNRVLNLSIADIFSAPIDPELLTLAQQVVERKSK